MPGSDGQGCLAPGVQGLHYRNRPICSDDAVTGRLTDSETPLRLSGACSSVRLSWGWETEGLVWRCILAVPTGRGAFLICSAPLSAFLCQGPVRSGDTRTKTLPAFELSRPQGNESAQGGTGVQDGKTPKPL